MTSAHLGKQLIQKEMSKNFKKHRCSNCKKMATWVYLPSSRGRIFFCDDCVSRGCTCNVLDLDMEEPDECLKDRTIWWSKEAYKKCLCEKASAIDYSTTERQPDSYHYEILDEKGRRLPCVEFDYSENGYDFESNVYVVTSTEVHRIFSKVKERHQAGNQSMVQGIEKIIANFTNNEYVVEYNKFMTKIAMFCQPYIIHTMFENDRLNLKFYNSFRSQLYEKRINIFTEEINNPF